MNVLSAVSLFAVLLYLWVGLLTYRLDRSAGINRLFLVWCSSMAVWSFGYAFVYVTKDSQHIWMKISAVGWCLFSAITLHMALLFTENRWVRKSAVKAVIYLPGLLFLYMSIFVFGPGKKVSGVVENFFYSGNFLYNFGYLLASIALIFVWGHRTENRRDKKQAYIIVIASLTPFLLNFFLQTLLPLWGVGGIPLMGHLYALIMLYGIYHAIRYYRLFDISAQRLNDQIFAEMIDLAILLSPEGRILKVSNSTQTLLGYGTAELVGKPVCSILYDTSLLEDILNEKQPRPVYRSSEVCCRTKKGELLPVSISCSPLIDSRLKEMEGIILVGHDIHATKQLEREIQEHKITEAQLRESEERFKAIFYQNTAMMYGIDFDSLYIFDTNEAARKYYGYSKEEFKSKKITDLNGLKEEEMREVLRQFDEKKQEVYHFKHRLANGEWRDVEIHATALLSKERKMVISIVTDITDRKKAEEYISFLAYHDTLTGLPNRKRFYETLHNELEEAKRKGEKLAVLFVDLDGFKGINDNYGHEAGDILLREVAGRLKANVRVTDLVARMGGDEFTLLILDIYDSKAAETVAGKIVTALEEPVVIGQNRISIQASIGISLFPDDGEGVDFLINQADSKMYTVKKGKGTARK